MDRNIDLGEQRLAKAFLDQIDDKINPDYWEERMKQSLNYQNLAVYLDEIYRNLDELKELEAGLEENGGDLWSDLDRASRISRHYDAILGILTNLVHAYAERNGLTQQSDWSDELINNASVTDKQAIESSWKRRAQRRGLDWDKMSEAEKCEKLSSLHQTEEFQQVHGLLYARFQKIEPHINEAERRATAAAIGDLCDMMDSLGINSQAILSQRSEGSQVALDQSGVFEAEPEQELSIEMPSAKQSKIKMSKVKIADFNFESANKAVAQQPRELRMFIKENQIKKQPPLDQQLDDSVVLLSDKSNVHMRGPDGDTEFTLASQQTFTSNSQKARKSTFVKKKKTAKE